MWYYVDGKERKGPVDESELQQLFQSGYLTNDSYVWKNGFANWTKIKDVSELSLAPSTQIGTNTGTQSLSELAGDKKNIFIRIGADRGVVPNDYGPFSIDLMKRLFNEKRINARTLVFTTGLSNWTLLGDFSDFQELFSETSNVAESDRRSAARKPFVARMFFHDNNQLYEGICRDISIGGMQVLVADYPGNVGDEISLNVHPENSEQHFVASGKIVRMLDKGQGFSFRFTVIETDAIKAIQKYISAE